MTHSTSQKKRTYVCCEKYDRHLMVDAFPAYACAQFSPEVGSSFAKVCVFDSWADLD